MQNYLLNLLHESSTSASSYQGLMSLVSRRLAMPCPAYLTPILIRPTSASLQAVRRQPLTPPHWVILLLTCLNHLSLASCILTTTEAASTLALISSFFTISFLVSPHIHLDIFNSKLSSFHICIPVFPLNV